MSEREIVIWIVLFTVVIYLLCKTPVTYWFLKGLCESIIKLIIN